MENFPSYQISVGGVMEYCHERFKSLLRYGRKNSGDWDECETHKEEYCHLPDDYDADDILGVYENFDALRAELEKAQEEIKEWEEKNRQWELNSLTDLVESNEILKSHVKNYAEMYEKAQEKNRRLVDMLKETDKKLTWCSWCHTLADGTPHKADCKWAKLISED